MIYFKFSLLDSKSKNLGISPDTAFDGLYSDDWFKDPWVADLLKQVEHCYAFGHNMISLDCEDVSFPAESLGQGVKALITARFVKEFSCNIDHIGENLYRFMDSFIADYDIHLVGCLNPYHLASLYEDTFPPILLEDFNKVISSSKEFQQFFYIWSRKIQPTPVTYRQLSNWNLQLSKPLEIDTRAKLVQTQKHVFGTKFTLFYKMNFIQSLSSEGKTFLLKRIDMHHELSIGFGKSIPYKTYVLRDLKHFFMYIASEDFDTGTRYLVLVDMDKFSQSITAMDALLDTPDNVIFLFVGHHLSSYIKVPLPSIYSCHLNRTDCSFMVSQSCIVHNTDRTEYDTVITEDSQSGLALFSNIAKDTFHTISAGGFGGIKSTIIDALQIPDSKNILVVMDYATGTDIIPQLNSMDFGGKIVDVILPTSSEYCLAFVSDEFDRFMHILHSYHSVREDRLTEELRTFSKGMITSETLDLLAFSQTFGYKTLREAKAAKVAVEIVKHLDKVYELIAREKDILKPNPSLLQDTDTSCESRSQLF